MLWWNLLKKWLYRTRNEQGTKLSISLHGSMAKNKSNYFKLCTHLYTTQNFNMLLEISGHDSLLIRWDAFCHQILIMPLLIHEHFELKWKFNHPIVLYVIQIPSNSSNSIRLWKYLKYISQTYLHDI